MATATDVVRALHNLTLRKAASIATAPTGLEPGYDTARGIAWTEDGRARYRDPTWTAGGGSTPLYGNGSTSSGTSYNASSYTLLTYSPSGFTSGVYTAPSTGKYLYTLYFRAGSAAWTAGDYLRIYEDINGSARIVDYFTIQASGTMFAQAKPSNIVSLSAGQGLSWYIYHTRSGGAITVDLTFVSILGFV